MSAVDRRGSCVVAMAAVTLVNAAVPRAFDPAAVPTAPTARIRLAQDPVVADSVEELTEAARGQLAAWFGVKAPRRD